MTKFQNSKHVEEAGIFLTTISDFYKCPNVANKQTDFNATEMEGSL
jgi:hypothetical protein